MSQDTPQSISELYPSKWLKAVDLPAAGRVATIERWEVQEFQRPDKSKEKSLVLYFERAHKALITNKTQLRALEQITGSEQFQMWVGVRVHLRPATAPNKKPTIAISKPVDSI